MGKKYNRLWIAEKPSAAQGLTVGLCDYYSTSIINRQSMHKDGFMLLGNGDVVSSTFGHMIRMLPPSRYLTKEQNNNPMSALPLIPDKFKYEPIPERNKDGTARMRDGKPVVSHRYTLLKKLVSQSKEIVNACDIDREGQLIFDELMEDFGVDPYGKNIKRIALVSFTEDDLRKTLDNIEDNGLPKWRGKGAAALARQKMDWLLGMNASMAYQAVTGMRNMSVGRVQTPVLNLVVERDLAIENFKPQDYYVPVVIMEDGTRLRWERRQDAEGVKGFDESGRIIDINIAKAIIEKIQKGLAGEVLDVSKQERRQAPPLPFSMGALQSEASRKCKLSVDEVTKAAQNLYERHKAITYVGTDCRFIPESMLEEAPNILKKLSGQFKGRAQGADPSRKPRSFDDKKIDEHFAIIPTGEIPNLRATETAERAVYDVICQRYIAQFYPDYRYVTASLTVAFDRDEFKATARKDIDLGWKAVESPDDDDDSEDVDAPAEQDKRKARQKRTN